MRNTLIVAMVIAMAGVGAQAGFDPTITLTWTLEEGVGFADCPCGNIILLDRYIITVSCSGTDNKINGIDAGGAASSHGTGFSDCKTQELDPYLDEPPCGPGSDTNRIFHQYWWWNQTPPPGHHGQTPQREDLFDVDPEQGLDTHWLFGDVQVIVTGVLAEDSDVSCNRTPNGADGGWGTYLVGTFGIQGPVPPDPGHQAASLDIAQLVVPHGQLPYVDIEVSSTNGERHFEQCIPEPATMCILVVGGVGVLFRRRR